MLFERQFTAVASQALVLEYESTIYRPEQRAVHLLTDQQLSTLLRELVSALTATAIHFTYRPQLRDANDEMVLEAAINGVVTTIVTHNVRDFLPNANRFGIDVTTPGRILRERLKR